jgi:hypothetical protein
VRNSGLDRNLRRRSGGQRSTGNVFLIPVVRFSPVSIIQQMFHSFMNVRMYNQRYITLATDNIVNTEQKQRL